MLMRVRVNLLFVMLFFPTLSTWLVGTWRLAGVGGWVQVGGWTGKIGAPLVCCPGLGPTIEGPEGGCKRRGRFCSYRPVQFWDKRGASRIWVRFPLPDPHPSDGALDGGGDRVARWGMGTSLGWGVIDVGGLRGDRGVG